MSKGDRPRPYSVDLKTFDNNWDSIFKKNIPEKQTPKEDSPVLEEKTQEKTQKSD
jgi:hypothetical protein